MMAVRGRGWIVGAVAFGAVVVAAAVIRGGREPDPVMELRDRLQVLRSASDSCRAGLEGEEAALHAYTAQLDSMRGRVRELENLHPDGVPVDSYPLYLREFEQYNDSAAAWPERADSVRARLTRCQDIVREHNATGDSLRNIIVERGTG